MKITIEDADANIVRQLLNGLSLQQGVVRTAPVEEGVRFKAPLTGGIAAMVRSTLGLHEDAPNLVVRDALFSLQLKAQAFDRLAHYAGVDARPTTPDIETGIRDRLHTPDTRALDATGAYMVGLARLLEHEAGKLGPDRIRTTLLDHAETLRRRGEALVSIPTAEAP